MLLNKKMINIATEYIQNHGLRFNTLETICHIKGQNPFTKIPRCYINAVSLDTEDKLTYLGSIMEENGGKKHCENRCRAAHRSFYGLQGAGIKSPGVNPQRALHLFNVGVSSTLTYGCAS